MLGLLRHARRERRGNEDEQGGAGRKVEGARAEAPEERKGANGRIIARVAAMRPRRIVEREGGGPR